MVVIEKAVLHVLDIDAAAAVYSDTLLPLEDGAKDFLIKSHDLHRGCIHYSINP